MMYGHKETQCNQVHRHLAAGRTLTTWQAINLFRCTRLAARIAELKERGVKIKTRMLTLRTGVRIAQYSL
jgi:hypothetical protein